MTTKILKNELLIHAVHGLCRVAEITKKTKDVDAACALRPVSQSRSKARFTVPLDLLESSGFNRMVSSKDALEILEYLKTGKKKESAVGNAWTLAVTLRAEARSKDISKDKRKGQQLNSLVKSLTNELSIVLPATVPETLEKMQESLAPVSKINPLILAAFSNVDSL